MERSEVYKIVDSEREYQNTLPSTRTDGKDRTVGDYLTMMTHVLHEAQKAWYDNPGDTQALEFVRKIAGISVRCMEEHGANFRWPIINPK